MLELGRKLAVPFLDLGAQYEAIQAEVREAIDSVLARSAFVLGPFVESFEESFAAYTKTKHCAGVSSGTAALHLALRALDVGSGDEVITTPLTFISTVSAINYVGARPVFVDVDPKTYTMDPDRIEGAISPRTKVIIPVHLYGQPVDMDPIISLAEHYGINVIEDAAQAHGAEYKGRRCGSLGHAACFSFYPSKTLGAYGEAGTVVTDHAGIDRRIRELRDHAQPRKNVHADIGFNYRMDGIQGAVLDVKLRHLDDWIEDRRQVAARYNHLLTGLSVISTPYEADYSRHVYQHYVVQLSSNHQRDSLRSYLSGDKIGTGLHYPRPVHLQPAYSHLGYAQGAFREAEDGAQRNLSLPMYPEMTSRHVRKVVTSIARWVEGNGEAE